MYSIIEAVISIYEMSGLDPLLKEFIYDIIGLDYDEIKSREKKISGYYDEVRRRTGSANMAYNATRKWAQKIFMQHYVKKAMDKEKENT